VTILLAVGILGSLRTGRTAEDYTKHLKEDVLARMPEGEMEDWRSRRLDA
jgi:hypothetical protein